MRDDLKAAAVQFLAAWDGDPLSQECILAVEKVRKVLLSDAEMKAERNRRFILWLLAEGGASHHDAPAGMSREDASDVRWQLLRLKLAAYDRDAKLQPTPAGVLFAGLVPAG